MGDRSNVFFADAVNSETDKLSGIYLYSHWMGTDLHRAAIDALLSKTARGRWDDSSYLARIIIHQILAKHADPECETGFGLSTMLTDNSYKILVVNMMSGAVYRTEEGSECDLFDKQGPRIFSFSDENIMDVLNS